MIAARAAWPASYSVERAAAQISRLQQALAALDKETTAALAVWGDIPP